MPKLTFAVALILFVTSGYAFAQTKVRVDPFSGEAIIAIPKGMPYFGNCQFVIKPGPHSHLDMASQSGSFKLEGDLAAQMFQLFVSSGPEFSFVSSDGGLRITARADRFDFSAGN